MAGTIQWHEAEREHSLKQIAATIGQFSQLSQLRREIRTRRHGENKRFYVS